MSKQVAQENESADDDDFHIYEKGDEPMLESQSVASKTPVCSSPSLNEIDSSKNTRALKSKVWQEMTRQTINGVLKAVCNHCHKKLDGKGSSGTTHLKNHLAMCRKTSSKEVSQMLLQAGERRKDGKVEFRTFAFDQARSRRDLLDMIVLHEYPLSIVDHHGFRKFAMNLQPLFELVTRNTIKSDIFKVYHSMKEKLIKDLEGLNTRVAITTDMWTAKPTKKGFMAITAHYIDSSWALQNRIVRTRKGSAASISSTASSKARAMRRQRKNGKIRAGSPGEEIALVEHLKGMSLAIGARRELKSLLAVLVLLGKDDSARKLQRVGETFQLYQIAAVKLAEDAMSSNIIDEHAYSLERYVRKARKELLQLEDFSWLSKIFLPL